MDCLITGVAGFIGSHLAEQLLAEGHRVIGIDCFTEYYARSRKQANLSRVLAHPQFRFEELDLSCDDLQVVGEPVELVFHLAAMPGLARSWTDFPLYDRHNVLATQRLLEACRDHPTLERLILASTSSVYGLYASGDEGLPLKPSSPYGITKLAAENLGRVYFDAFEVPVVCLRYFSVYGPGQRPDMGYYRFIDALLHDRPITIYGDGQQIRGNTFIRDCVAATFAAVQSDPGEVYNVGGGELVSVRQVIHTIEQILGKQAILDYQPPRPGDQRYTGADIRKFRRRFGWQPQVGIEQGLAEQIAWQRQQATRRAA